MKKISLLLLFTAMNLFGFESKFIPMINNVVKNLQCSQVLHKKAFDICYSYKEKHPLAVAYVLKKELVNKNLYSRKGLRFRPDYNLPTRYRSYSKDYSRTGFDRGHNAPNADFDYSRAIQKETFLMSNITPQKPQLNRRYWAKLEKLERFLAVKYKKVEVVTGSCGHIGTIKNKVGIPKYWYKIIYINGLKKDYLAFLVPNTNQNVAKAKIKDYAVGVFDIKEKCGF